MRGVPKNISKVIIHHPSQVCHVAVTVITQCNMTLT
jgi:hypothetical protein